MPAMLYAGTVLLELTSPTPVCLPVNRGSHSQSFLSYFLNYFLSYFLNYFLNYF